MVMAVKERFLTGIMQSRRWRENTGSVTFPKARQTGLFICVCFDQPNRRIRDQRMSGGVGGAACEGRSYPDSAFICLN